MPFESLSERHEFLISGFPEQWLPLTYLYDPDLPLFPIIQFHVLDPAIASGARPGERDRAFGFVHHINLLPTGLKVSLATNKDFSAGKLSALQSAVEAEVSCLLGLADPVTIGDLKGCFSGPLAHANQVVEELWYKIVDQAFGGKLPFGRLWDPVFGLARFIASWNSEGGRKGELIQTHSFVKHFGVRIHTGGGIHADFYLLPTMTEFTDASNPLSIFPRFSRLIAAAQQFVAAVCDQIPVASLKFSAFRPAKAGFRKLNTANFLGLLKKFGAAHQEAILDLYSDFDRGPHRSLIALSMLNDLRRGYWHPLRIGAAEAAASYPSLEGSYQSPKVIHLYSQLCFGNKAALPIDTWVKTFLRWPLGLPVGLKRTFHSSVFGACSNWGKVERLIWIAAQARKVHSSVAEDTLWCIRYGAPRSGTKVRLRGANPLSCKICANQVRDVCPGYASIAKEMVGFNGKGSGFLFNVVTSAKNNSSAGQTIESCYEVGPSSARADEYSTRDEKSSFGPFPAVGDSGKPITVSEFVAKY